MFAPKSERETIAERERLEAEDLAVEERKQIVVEKIREEEEIQKNMEAEDVETDEKLNEAEDYERWKARKIARIKRDREGREVTLREKVWPSPALKRKWMFLKKYCHNGAFFQADPPGDQGICTRDFPCAFFQADPPGDQGIYTRDFSAPNGEDKMDKSILPRLSTLDAEAGPSGLTSLTKILPIGTTRGLIMTLSGPSTMQKWRA